MGLSQHDCTFEIILYLHPRFVCLCLLECHFGPSFGATTPIPSAYIVGRGRSSRKLAPCRTMPIPMNRDRLPSEQGFQSSAAPLDGSALPTCRMMTGHSTKDILQLLETWNWRRPVIARPQRFVPSPFFPLDIGNRKEKRPSGYRKIDGGSFGCWRPCEASNSVPSPQPKAPKECTILLTSRSESSQH